MSLFIIQKPLRLQRKLNNLMLSLFGRGMCTVELPTVPNSIFKNPYMNYQQCFEIPILKKSDNYWEPSVESMKAALDLFIPKPVHTIERVCQTIHPNRFPDHNVPEVAFIGRSNSGKSSLLKAIFHNVPELQIQTSKKSGHTRSLKFYKVGTNMCLVDMPGYGFRAPKWFETSVVYYLKNRKNLVKTFLLIDSKVGFHDWDDASIQMLGDIKVPFAIVLAKIDAVADSQCLKTLLHLRNILNEFQLNTCFPQIFLLSSHTFVGLPYFVSFVAHITGNLNPQVS